MSEQTSALAYFEPKRVRAQSRQLLSLAEDGKLEHVHVRPDKLGIALQSVLEVARQSYPDLQIPPYGVWRSFEAGGFDRWAALAGARAFESAGQMLASAADLAVLSCFMTTRRPTGWTFEDPMTRTRTVREEASALAAFQMFASGSFSSDMTDPYRVDAETLIRLEREELASGLQWSLDENADLIAGMQRHLKRFGEAMALRPDVFCKDDATRPGLHALKQAEATKGTVEASRLLDGLLETLSPVWDGGATKGDIALGDSFGHASLPDQAEPFVQPFHMSAQQMVYSLVEPFAWAGIEMSGLDELTAPADLAHLALFVETGAIVIASGEQTLSPKAAQDRMVELRAVSLALTEQVAQMLRGELDVSADQLPLSCVLEAGTRRAGEHVLLKDADKAQKLASFLNPGSVFWLPFGA